MQSESRESGVERQAPVPSSGGHDNVEVQGHEFVDAKLSFLNKQALLTEITKVAGQELDFERVDDASWKAIDKSVDEGFFRFVRMAADPTTMGRFFVEVTDKNIPRENLKQENLRTIAIQCEQRKVEFAQKKDAPEILPTNPAQRLRYLFAKAIRQDPKTIDQTYDLHLLDENAGKGYTQLAGVMPGFTGAYVAELENPRNPSVTVICNINNRRQTGEEEDPEYAKKMPTKKGRERNQKEFDELVDKCKKEGFQAVISRNIKQMLKVLSERKKDLFLSDPEVIASPNFRDTITISPNGEFTWSGGLSDTVTGFSEDLEAAWFRNQAEVVEDFVTQFGGGAEEKEILNEGINFGEDVAMNTQRKIADGSFQGVIPKGDEGPLHKAMKNIQAAAKEEESEK